MPERTSVQKSKIEEVFSFPSAIMARGDQKEEKK
jgi:hypothetical protein